MAIMDDCICPFVARNCRTECVLYDTQFQTCVVAAVSSSLAAWASMKLVEGLVLDETSPRDKLFKALVEQARVSVAEGLQVAKEREDHENE